jgi:hypothetical protein
VLIGNQEDAWHPPRWSLLCSMDYSVINVQLVIAIYNYLKTNFYVNHKR